MERRTKSLPPAARAAAAPVAADFMEEGQGGVTGDAEGLLDDLVGCEAVREKVCKCSMPRRR